VQVVGACQIHQSGIDFASKLIRTSSLIFELLHRFVYFALQECKAPKGEIPLEPPKPVCLRFDKLAEARVKRGHVLITEGNTIKCRQCLAIVPRCSARQFLTHSGTCTPYNAFESSMAEGGSFKAQLREREWPSDQGKVLFRTAESRTAESTSNVISRLR
jgi:hypothetical protein